jgi:hypothetical protein
MMSDEYGGYLAALSKQSDLMLFNDVDPITKFGAWAA